MDDLLPHYERELGLLRAQAEGFAQRYPEIAGRLKLSGDVGEDPHVERLVQAFALLSARVHKRLDDDFPQFTETFLDVLYPHYLRPFPSCALARFDIAGASAQLTRAVRLPRGTMLSSRAVRGVNCRFRTAYDVDLAPLRVAALSFRALGDAPSGTDVPAGTTAWLSLELQLESPQARWDTLGLPVLRLAMDGEASQIAVLREVLFGRLAGVALQTSPHGAWRRARSLAPRPVGFADDEALIDFDDRSHPAYRLLTEYFAFPDKFDFIDIPLPDPAMLAGAAPRSITLHFALQKLRSDSDEARLLQTIDARNLLTACTPVVNLFRQRADPIRITQARDSYPVLPDARRAYGYEVHSVDKVFRLAKTPQGESIQEFAPFYSLRHDELLAEGEHAGRYWHLHRDAGLGERSPGFEAQLSIVDVDFDPASPQTDTLSIDVTATNRDLPTQLSVGNAGGDLTQEGGSLAREIRLLRRPTSTWRFEAGRGSLWRLISHLSLNHLSLSGGGLDALKELLRLYDLPRSPTNRRQIEGLVGIACSPVTATLRGQPFPTFVRGVEVRLTVDEQAFVGTGLRLLAEVLDRFFGLYVHANSFARLVVVSARGGEPLFEGARRAGQGPLL